MEKKLLVDLFRMRDYDQVPVEGIMMQDGYELSFKTIRELATFQYTCRKCENAPCIKACPVEALSKTKEGVINRAMYRCIRCKTCIVTCPFGTMVDDLFEAKSSGRPFICLSNEDALIEFAAYFPPDVVQVVEMDEKPEENIFQLSDKILIKEKTWK